MFENMFTFSMNRMSKCQSVITSLLIDGFRKFPIIYSNLILGRFDGEAGNYGQGGTPFGENFYDGKLIKEKSSNIVLE